MVNPDKKDESDSSSGNNDTAGSTTTSDTENNTAAIRPDETSATEAPRASGNDTQQSEGLSRSLGESVEVKQEKTPEQVRQEEISRKIDEAVVRYNLNDVETKNLSVSLSQPGIEPTDSFVKKQVQAIAPVKLEIAEFKEKFGATMVNVDNSRSGQLSLQAVGSPQQEISGPVPPR